MLLLCTRRVTYTNPRLLTDATAYHMKNIQRLRTTQQPIRGEWVQPKYKRKQGKKRRKLLSPQELLVVVLKKLVSEQRFVRAYVPKRKSKGLGVGDIGEFGLHSSTPGCELLQDDKSAPETDAVCSMVRVVQRCQLLDHPDKYQGVLCGGFTCHVSGHGFSSEQRARLIQHVDSKHQQQCRKLRALGRDSACSDFKLSVDVRTLEGLVGRAALRRLVTLFPVSAWC